MKQLPIHLFAIALLSALGSLTAQAGTKTWDGRYDTSKIDVTVVYFVPQDRQPLVDWRDRVDYFCRRIEMFHAREFQGQSELTTRIHAEPLVSDLTTTELRAGDANAIYFRTLSEADRKLEFAKTRDEAFPILLVLSEINWRPLDDFYRVHPSDGRFEFEGNLGQEGEHFPGATSGGARAAYLADRGVGWGLVSADGWRVPYRGTDCVIYHEGCGHTVGLPHPEPGNGSVMSLGQYRGWISESWLDKDQKSRLGWEPQATGEPEPQKYSPSQLELFSRFRAIATPVVPRPGEAVQLKLDWPDNAQVKSLRVRYQTSITAPWVDVDLHLNNPSPAPSEVDLATFDRETPVSYRIDAELDGGETAELWGYLQVRSDPDQTLLPILASRDLESIPEANETATSPAARIDTWPSNEVDLLSRIDLRKQFKSGEWKIADGRLESPKAFGARLELPYSPPREYRLCMIVEPLDEPHGLLIGNCMRSSPEDGKVVSRFVTLFNYRVGADSLSAIENVDGRNVGNDTTFKGNVFKQNQLSQVVVTVRQDRVQMSVDGRMIVDWKGAASRLGLSDYWSTPRTDALMLGAYDCRYRIHRMTLEPLSNDAK